MARLVQVELHYRVTCHDQTNIVNCYHHLQREFADKTVWHSKKEIISLHQLPCLCDKETTSKSTKAHAPNTLSLTQMWMYTPALWTNMLTSVYVCVHVCVHRSLCVCFYMQTHTHTTTMYTILITTVSTATTSLTTTTTMTTTTSTIITITQGWEWVKVQKAESQPNSRGGSGCMPPPENLEI